MKKILLSLVVCATVCLMTVSCSKEDDYSLLNTTWKCVEDSVTTTFYFSSTDCRMIISSSGSSVSYNGDYYYTLNYPTVLMSSQKSNVANLEGKINSNLMTITNTSTSKIIGVYEKQ